MATINLVRQDRAIPSEKDLAIIRSFLFGLIDGHGEEDMRAWRLFWRKVLNLEIGELLSLVTEFSRSGPFHRRHMKIEQMVFDSQERFTDFEQFRVWLKIGAGWVNWFPGAKGGIVPVPRSISYRKADEAQFREFHIKVIEFLRGGHAAHRLWPHLDAARGAEMVETILGGFGE